MSENTYLIVGGTRGMGRATVEQLAGPDRDLLVMARNRPEDPLPDGVSFRSVDVRTVDPQDLDLPATLDGLAYFPGTIRLRPFDRLSMDEFREDWDVNVGGAIRILQQAADPLADSDGRSGIVLVSTVATRVGMKYHASVAAAKAAVEGLARSLAAEWAPDVAVNVIAPSVTDTSLASDLLKSDRKRERSRERHPLKEINRPEDVASLAALLMTERLNITGEVIGVDGGLARIREV